MKRAPRVTVMVTLPVGIPHSRLGAHLNSDGAIVFEPENPNFPGFLRHAKDLFGYFPALQYGCKVGKVDLSFFDWYAFCLPRFVELEQDECSSENQLTCGRSWGLMSHGQMGCSIEKKRVDSFRFKKRASLRLPDIFEIGPGPIVSSRIFGASEQFVIIANRVGALNNVDVRDILTYDGKRSGFFELSIRERPVCRAAVAERNYDEPCKICRFSFVDTNNFPMNTINRIYRASTLGNDSIEVDDFFIIDGKCVRSVRGMRLWRRGLVESFMEARLTGLSVSNLAPCLTHEVLYDWNIHPRQIFPVDFFLSDGYRFGSDSEPSTIDTGRQGQAAPEEKIDRP